MELFLIKIGKAWRTLRQDGLIRGSQRVLVAFRALFDRVHPGNILFITGGVGDSARYRTKHVAEELAFHGFACSVTVQDNPFLPTYAEQFSVFIFHRVFFTPRVAKLIEEIKKLKKEIIFETDDLVYDPQFLKYMAGYDAMNALERRLYEGGLGSEIINDPFVRTCTTTTAYLAAKLSEKGKQIFILRNKVSEADAVSASKILENTKKDSSSVRISYFSGTASHDGDFAIITPALVLLLEKYPAICLVLAGPLRIGDTLDRFKTRIERVPFLSRQEYFSKLARMDINLAPLEIGNPFCESKSELKWIEAGLMAVPTVASATETFEEAIMDGDDGSVAETTDEWVAKLSRLIEDAPLRAEMGAKAREKVLGQYTTRTGKNEAYYNYLRSKIV